MVAINVEVIRKDESETNV